jgi:hypothetical protein
MVSREIRGRASLASFWPFETLVFSVFMRVREGSPRQTGSFPHPFRLPVVEAAGAPVTNSVTAQA